MFGLFKKKKYKFNCPMCDRAYETKFDPSQVTEFDYPYGIDAGYVGPEACGFCKTKMTVLLKKNGGVIAVDEKWEKVQSEYEDKLSAIDDEIMDIEDRLEDEKDNVALRKKIEQLESKREKLQESYDNKTDKYEDRRGRWEQKWIDKLDK